MIGVVHGSKFVTKTLSRQNIGEYVKPSKKSSLPAEYNVEDGLYETVAEQYELFKKIDQIWLLGRLDLSDIERNSLNFTCKGQLMSGWSAFNSIVTDENLPETSVGFMPLITEPVTEYKTVYTALKNFQNVVSQLQQPRIRVACAEGVCKIARDILLTNPSEFGAIVLLLGSFHMIKIVLGCIGKYLQGSGAESIWTENAIF